MPKPVFVHTYSGVRESRGLSPPPGIHFEDLLSKNLETLAKEFVFCALVTQCSRVHMCMHVCTDVGSNHLMAQNLDRHSWECSLWRTFLMSISYFLSKFPFHSYHCMPVILTDANYL